MPSTRRPPLNMTLPSMRVVAPMRLSIRFCGLLALLNIALVLSLSQCHRVGRSRLRRSGLVHAHLHALHLRLRADPESPLDSLEVLESQLESGSAGICRLGGG